MNKFTKWDYIKAKQWQFWSSHSGAWVVGLVVGTLFCVPMLLAHYG